MSNVDPSQQSGNEPIASIDLEKDAEKKGANEQSNADPALKGSTHLPESEREMLEGSAADDENEKPMPEDGLTKLPPG